MPSVTASPAGRANRRRNDQTTPGRLRRWSLARDAAWVLIARHLQAGDRVLIVGAGNGEDLPLDRIAGRAERLDLADLDPDALRRARRRAGLRRRRTVGLHEIDVTGGAADAIVRAAPKRLAPPPVPDGPVGEPPYDLVIADVFYTQLVYPALLDRELDRRAIETTLMGPGQALVDAVVARLRTTAAGGRLLHLHDVVGWWDDHEQPFAIEQILAAEPEAARRMIARCGQPRGTRLTPEHVIDTALWRWPFADGVDYLVQAYVEQR